MQSGDSTKCAFAAYSAHDYSILSLLSALGVKEYPGEPIGYTAYVRISMHRGSDEVLVEFNPFPFDHHSSSVLHTGQIQRYTFTLDQLID